MKPRILVMISILLLSGCTNRRIMDTVYYDKLEQKNVCFTELAIETPTKVFIGKVDYIGLRMYSDSKIKIRAQWGLRDEGKDIEEVMIRIDNNPILKIKDNNPKDIYFLADEQEELQKQLINGEKIILRLNYYDGDTLIADSDISK